MILSAKMNMKQHQQSQILFSSSWRLMMIVTAAHLLSVVPVDAFSMKNSRSSSNRVFVSTPASKFPKKLVSEYMTKPMLVLTPETSVNEAMEMFLQNGITGAPVVKKIQKDGDSDSNGQPSAMILVGMLSSFDFLQKEAFEGSLLPMEGTIETVERYVHAAQRICGSTVADVMTSADELSTVTANTPMREAALIMTEHKLHRLPVIKDVKASNNSNSSDDNNKVLIGMLTAEHVIQDLMHFVRSLPPAAATDISKTTAPQDEPPKSAMEEDKNWSP